MFYSIGVIVVVILGAILIHELYNFMKKLLWGSDLLRTQLISVGKWAVVTGSTDGIGKAYAKFFASKKFSIVLISRSHDKLKAVSKEIESEFNVDTKIIVADFTKGFEIKESIKKELEPIKDNIGILVNNVGMSLNHPEYYLNIANLSEFTQNIINCNIVSMHVMTEIILPLMIEKKNGIIINISSTVAKISNPLLSIYAATKAYVCKFSEDLRVEYAASGVQIQCVLPGLVTTSMTKLKKPTIFSPSPKDFVRNAVKTIGTDTVTTGYHLHGLQLKIFQILSFFLPQLFESSTFKVMSSLRERQVRKLKK